ncbi:alpha/beta hydrolase [Notoacmeibacter sp. MSK16QG-6]|uniref:RBBP9/YdeN family alpha/beta hydrolase n=1 Tax=Notoacmeibacter sp. MSK16QG-6 TaxID=2957982 RepID=UPI00209D690B|nr:alpha/beta hydrolase [Notoacmeibacter sp. MSK16QG-6]MCP1199447.1 alpha/beta hydrolase [Notoacmeibacter sp. MSK16QG-6]
MKAKNATILFLPDQGRTDDGHWLSRWQAKLSTGHIVDVDPDAPKADDWFGKLESAVEAHDGPIVLVGHGLGAATAALSAPKLTDRVKGAFLVAPPALDEARKDDTESFGPYRRDPFPFPSIVVASRTDPNCPFETIEDLAGAWGSLLIDGGDIGRINEESGHGPWPEGLLTFARFLSRLPD